MKASYFGRLLLLPIIICFAGIDAQQEWTSLHRKFFSTQELLANKHKHKIVYSKLDLPNFTQLIFSWNAARPLHGYFTFWVQVRDSHTKKWTQWFKMIEWGKGVQRSFKSDLYRGIEYIHVRLETGKHFGDGFRIKVEPQGGADLSYLQGMNVALSDLTLFAAENKIHYLPSIMVKGVPTFSQFLLDHPRNAALCSPTSSAMVCSYLLQRIIDPLEFAEGSYDYGLEVYGSWPFNTAHMFEISQGEIHSCVCRLPSFKHLYKELSKGLPVIVSVRGPLQGSATPYSGGHLLVVVGWDAKTNEVICHDPAFDSSKAVIKRYPLQDFLLAWERSHRLAYVVELAK